MSSDKLAKLSALLERALDLPATERAALLERLAVEDPEGERMLRRSLTGPDSGFLQPVGETRREAAVGAESSNAPLFAVDRPGDRIGPYLLVETLGSGGMGTVWLAERVDGHLRRQVALKLPRVWGPALLEQLTRERDFLAALEHPHIARLYDAGVTEAGRPYLALEYVDGETIDAYCRNRGESIEGRLRLFLQVARAVAYAHARLIIHRDIKPANILVGSDGQARLLDFGIARLLDASPSGTTTLLGARPLTPAYASPEQIAGERLTVASDVYSLGVALYELLTAERPYVLTEEGGPALARDILNAKVVAPSLRAKTPGVAQRLAGDLDVIVLKALAKDPRERYPNVEALTLDLERHLAGEPVLARSASGWYRLGKLVRRHRLAVASVGLVAVAIVGGAAVSLWQAKVARGEARRAENVKSFIAQVFTEATPRTGIGGEVTAADLLAAASRRFEASLDEEPRVAVELGVLIGEAFDALGETGKGLAAVKIAAALGERELGPRHPLSLRARYLLINCHDALGQFEESEKLVPALIVDSRAGLPGSARILVGALSAQSFEQAKREQAEEAVASLKEAIAVGERYLGKDDDATIRNVGLLANTYGRFGDWARQLEAAEDAFRRSTAKYGGQRPHVVLTHSERWYAEALLFNLRPAEAVEILERVVEDQRRLDTVDTPRVRAALQRLAESYQAIGQLDKAVPLIRTVVELEAQQNPTDSDDRLGVLGAAGRIFVTARLLDEALVMLERHQEIARRFGDPGAVYIEVTRARTLVWLGRDEGDQAAAAVIDSEPVAPAAVATDAVVVRAQHARWQARPSAALAFATDALRRSQAAGVSPFSRAAAHCEAGLAWLDSGNRAEAEPAIQHAFEELEKARVPASLRSADCALARARIHLASGRADAASELLLALDNGYAAINPTSPFRGEVLHYLAQAQAARGQAAPARETAARAKALLARSSLPALKALLR